MARRSGCHRVSGGILENVFPATWSDTLNGSETWLTSFLGSFLPSTANNNHAGPFFDLPAKVDKNGKSMGSRPNNS